MYFALRSFMASIFRTAPATRSPRSRSCSAMRRPKPLFTPVINHVLCDIARFLSSFTARLNGSGVALAIRF